MASIIRLDPGPGLTPENNLDLLTSLFLLGGNLPFSGNFLCEYKDVKLKPYSGFSIFRNKVFVFSNKS